MHVHFGRRTVNYLKKTLQYVYMYNLIFTKEFKAQVLIFCVITAPLHWHSKNIKNKTKQELIVQHGTLTWQQLHFSK